MLQYHSIEGPLTNNNNQLIVTPILIQDKFREGEGEEEQWGEFREVEG